MLSMYLSMVETEEQRGMVGRLYIDQKQTMYHTAFAILKNKQDAEDAVHEAFLRIITNIDKLSEIGSEKIKSFVIIVVKNIAIDIYRKRLQITTVDASEDDDTDISEVERKVLESSEYDILNKVVGMLPETQRNVLILKYYHDMTTADISAMLGVTASAVRTRICRAERKLAKLLEEENR